MVAAPVSSPTNTYELADEYFFVPHLLYSGWIFAWFTNGLCYR